MKKLVFLIFLICLAFPSLVNAKAYLPIKYKMVRYDQSTNNSKNGTTIWYAKIPNKYKMHYAYGRDKLFLAEQPSENAKRHNATLAVNTQFLGFPIVNGKKLSDGADVSGYDFYITKNSKSNKIYDIFNVYAVDPTDARAGISLENINVGYEFFGDFVPYKSNFYGVKNNEIYMAVFAQVVKNGKFGIGSTVKKAKSRNPHTWIAYDYKGNQYVAVCAGRDAPLQNGKKLKQAGLTYEEMVTVTKKYMTKNIKTLYNLDGGGSTSFVYKGKKINPNYDENNTVERWNYGAFYWKEEQYKVLFSANGGTGSVDSIVCTHNDNCKLRTNAFAKIGYTFSGWNTKANGTGINYANGQTVKNLASSGSVTLYAKWAANKYNIVYNLNGGKKGNKAPSQGVYNNALYIDYPVKSGFVFTGWTVSKGLNSVTAKYGNSANNITSAIKNSSTKIKAKYFKNLSSSNNSSVTLSANFEQSNYSITYKLNGASDPANIRSYNANTNTFTLKNPYKKGYTFVGWSGTGISGKQKTVTIAKGSSGNRTYTANFEINKVKIKYNVNGGKLAKEHGANVSLSGNNIFVNNSTIIQTVNYNSKMSVNGLIDYDNASFINIEKAGYKAVSGAEWKTAGGKTYNQKTVYKASDFCIAETSDCTLELYVNWQNNDYTIQYSLNGGNVTGNITSYSVYTSTFTLKNPTREGYIFDGWSGTGLKEKTKNVTISKGSVGNRSYVANWSLQNYKINYDLDGGKVSANPTSFNVTTSTFTLKNPTKEGYTFAGWSGTGIKGKQNIVTIKKGSVGNRSYKANYEQHAYSITYNLNGGIVSDNPGGYDVSTPTFTLKNPTKEGYTFAGWSGTGISGKQKTVTIAKGSSGNKSYTANYTRNTYTITYNLNGANVTNPTSYNVETNTFTLKNPARQGYMFTGWTGSNGSDGQNEVTIAKGSVGNRTYTANYAPISYTLTYETKGGIADNPGNYNIETNTFTLNNPTREGYTFTGWTGNGGTTALKTVTINKGSSGNKSYKANYTINKVNIKYNMNGGSLAAKHGSVVSASGQNVLQNNSLVIHSLNYGSKLSSLGLANYNNSSAINIEKTGYKAVSGAEWNTSSSLNGKSFDQTTQYNALDFCDLSLKSCTIELFVNWTPVSYKISYDLNGGTVSANPDEYNIETNTFTLNNPVRDGYTFDGWSGTGVSGKVKTLTINKGSFGNKSYKANFSANKYTITYETNGGSEIAAQNISYGDNITEPPIPVRDGFKFSGWYSDEQLNNRFSFTTMPKADITLYAKWVSLDLNVINYVLNSGVNNSLNPAFYDGSSDIVLYDAAKEGYDFEGWYLDEQFNERIETISASTGRDLVLYAKFNPKTFEISFNSNGGSNVDSIFGKYKDSINPPTNPTMDGFEFVGWYKDSGLTEEFIFDYMPSTNVTLYAKYTKNTYTVTYNTNGGLGLSSVILESGERLVAPSEPIREGYEFAGWYSDEGLSSLYNFDSAVYSDLTLYAKWVAKQYVVAYDTNEGSLIDSKSVTFKEEVPIPNNPLKKGYTFRSWLNDDLEDYTSGLMPAHDVTLYANWVANSYTISFNSNGGSEVTSIEKAYGEEVLEPSSPVRDGYKFAGWYSDEQLNSLYSFTTMPSENITLYAKWAQNENVIKYETNGGVNSSSNPTVYFAGEEKVINAASKDGYEFAGWYLDEDFQTRIDSITKTMNADLVLYARWIANSYTISFNSNGGSEVASIEKAYEQKIEEPDIPKREGYDFLGWYSDEDLTKEFIFDTMPAKDMVLYAKWDKTSNNTISFEVNGGNNVNQIREEAGLQIEAPNDPYKAGYKFAGWYSDKALTQLYSFTTMPSESITLYAKWVSNDVNIIKYVLGGGVNSPANPTYYSMGSEIELFDPIRDGYDFLGWYTDSKMENRIEFINNEMDADLVLYAKWGQNPQIVNVPITARNISSIVIFIGLVLVALSSLLYYLVVIKKKINI